MENRSYDHYFGAYPKGRGFDDHPKDSLGAFAQPYPGGGSLQPPDVLLPFHLDVAQGYGCTQDIGHGWGTQHSSWDGGKMDGFVKAHVSGTGGGGVATMGYYQRADLPYHWALADTFTLCDGYHCSVLGPTHPNRLMAVCGTIDPAGRHGVPITDTNSDPGYQWSLTCTTVQELLEDAGISWKYYNPSNVYPPLRYADLASRPEWNPALYNPSSDPDSIGVDDNIMPYFKAFENQSSSLYQKAFLPGFPGDFFTDVTPRRPRPLAADRQAARAPRVVMGSAAGRGRAELVLRGRRW